MSRTDSSSPHKAIWGTELSTPSINSELAALLHCIMGQWLHTNALCICMCVFYSWSRPLCPVGAEQFPLGCVYCGQMLFRYSHTLASSCQSEPSLPLVFTIRVHLWACQLNNTMRDWRLSQEPATETALKEQTVCMRTRMLSFRMKNLFYFSLLIYYFCWLPTSLDTNNNNNTKIGSCNENNI